MPFIHFNQSSCLKSRHSCLDVQNSCHHLQSRCILHCRLYNLFHLPCIPKQSSAFVTISISTASYFNAFYPLQPELLLEEPPVPDDPDLSAPTFFLHLIKTLQCAGRLAPFRVALHISPQQCGMHTCNNMLMASSVQFHHLAQTRRPLHLPSLPPIRVFFLFGISPEKVLW